MSRYELKTTKLTLISMVSLTITMHFVLPYAAMAEMKTHHGSPHAPPSYSKEDSEEEHLLHDELPPHIEVKESDLEGISEETFARDRSHQISPQEIQAPYRAIFVYSNESKAGFNKIEPLSFRVFMPLRITKKADKSASCGTGARTRT